MKTTKTRQERVQLILGERSVMRLDKLKARVEPESRTEVIRNALRLYEAIVDDVDRGLEYYIKTQDGEFVRCRFFLND